MVTERKGHHGPTTFQGQALSDMSTKPSWYTEKIDSIPSAGRELLENYSGIPPDEVLRHVRAIRDQAFAIWSYACIGQVRFLDYKLPEHNFYTPALEILRAGGTFLDAGCCFGQELRFLAHKEHIPATQLYGLDLEPGFIEMGYALFRDEGRFDAHMLSGDLLNLQLHPLTSTIDIIHLSSVLHIWPWTLQLTAAKNLIPLLRPIPGTLIIGSQMGSTSPGEYAMPTSTGTNYRHDVASLKRFWTQVGAETDTEWDVTAGTYTPALIAENRGQSWARDDPGMCMVWFMVRRL